MSNYPDNWDSLRKRVYARDDYSCQNCGVYGGPKGDAELHAHHIVPLEFGGSNELTNLSCLCDECHDAAHGRGMAPTTDEEHSPEVDVLEAAGEARRNYRKGKRLLNKLPF